MALDPRITNQHMVDSFKANPSTNIVEINNFINVIFSVYYEEIDTIGKYMITHDAKLLYALLTNSQSLTDEQLVECRIKFPTTYYCWASTEDYRLVDWMNHDFTSQFKQLL